LCGSDASSSSIAAFSDMHRHPLAPIERGHAGSWRGRIVSGNKVAKMEHDEPQEPCAVLFVAGVAVTV
jgi:hypothetical protein